MDKSLEKPIFIIILLSLLSGYLFFFQSKELALTDPDESFYAETAKEMLEKGEWLTPYIYNKAQFEKPILFYWLVEASFKIFGINEFTARLPSAIFAFFGLVAIYLLGGIIFNKRTGVLAALILATNVEYIMLSRACVTDMVLGTFILWGLLLFFYGSIRGKAYAYILSSIAFALATLTKGPIGLLLPGAVIFSYLLIIRDFKIIRKIPVIWCVVVFLAAALPWYLVMHKIHGKAFIDAFFGFQNITRFLESEHEIGAQVYYNIPIVFGGLFPWSVFLPLGFWRVFKTAFTKENIHRNHAIFILLWFFIIFIFFSVSSTKLPTYIFPSFAALALIVAFVWDEFLRNDAPKSVSRGMKWSYYLLLAAIVLGMAGLYLLISRKYPTILNGAIISGFFLLFGFVLSLIEFKSRRFLSSFFFIIFSVILFLYPLGKLVLPEIERYETSKEVSQKLVSLMKPGERLGAESNYLAGLAFYTGIMPIDIDKHNTMVKFLRSEKRVWCVLKEKNHRQLYELDTKPCYKKPSYMVYKLGKKCIITNNIPENGVYLLKRERLE